MKIYEELICQELCEYIIRNLKNSNIDYNKIIQTKAVNALNEIKTVIQNTELDDFEIVEGIICIFEKYNIDVGSQHDF